MLQLISESLDTPASSEADHRIANHLSLIASLLRLQTRALAESKSLSKEDAVWLLEDCGHRIETVAGVHRLLAAQADHHARSTFETIYSTSRGASLRARRLAGNMSSNRIAITIASSAPTASIRWDFLSENWSRTRSNTRIPLASRGRSRYARALPAIPSSSRFRTMASAFPRGLIRRRMGISVSG